MPAGSLAYTRYQDRIVGPASSPSQQIGDASPREPRFAQARESINVAFTPSSSHSVETRCSFPANTASEYTLSVQVFLRPPTSSTKIECQSFMLGPGRSFFMTDCRNLEPASSGFL